MHTYRSLIIIRLLRKGVTSLYSQLFPLSAIVRVLVCTGDERFGSDSTTPEPAATGVWNGLSHNSQLGIEDRAAQIEAQIAELLREKQTLVEDIEKSQRARMQ